MHTFRNDGPCRYKRSCADGSAIHQYGGHTYQATVFYSSPMQYSGVPNGDVVSNKSGAINIIMHNTVILKVRTIADLNCG